MAYDDTQDEGAATRPSAPRQSLVDAAIAHAKSMSQGTQTAIPQDDQSQIRQQQDPGNAIVEWAKRKDPGYWKGRAQDLWDNPAALASDHVKTYRSLPGNLQAREQQQVMEDLGVLNHVFLVKQLANGIGDTQSPFLAGLGGAANLFGLTPGWQKSIEEKLSGKWMRPLYQVNGDGKQVEWTPTSPDGESFTNADAMRKLTSGLSNVEKLGVQNPYDAKVWSILNKFSTAQAIQQPASFIGEVALTQKLFGAAGKGLRGVQGRMAPTVVKGAEGAAESLAPSLSSKVVGGAARASEFMAGQGARGAQAGAFTSFVGPFGAHEALSKGGQALVNFDTNLQKQLATEVIPEGKTFEQVKDERSGLVPRLSAFTKSGAMGFVDGAIRSMPYLVAHKLIGAAGGAIFSPKPATGLQETWIKAGESVEQGWQKSLQDWFQSNGKVPGFTRLGTRFVKTGLEFTVGGKGSEVLGHLLLGEPPPKWDSRDVGLNFVVGGFLGGMLGGRGRPAEEAAPKTPEEMQAGLDKKWTTLVNGTPKTYRPYFDEMVANGIPKEKVIELATAAQGYGADAAAKGEQLYAEWQRVHTTGKGPEFKAQAEGEVGPPAPEAQFTMQGPQKAGPPAKETLMGERTASAAAQAAQQATQEAETKARPFRPPATVEATVEAPGRSPEERGVERLREAMGQEAGPITEEDLNRYKATRDRLDQEVDLARAAGDRRAATAAQSTRTLLDREGDISDTEKAHLRQALGDLEETLSPRARGRRFEDIRLRNAQRDFQEDLEKIDRAMRTVSLATGQVPKEMTEKRAQYQRMLDMAERGQMPPGYEPRPREMASPKGEGRPGGTSYARYQAEQEKAAQGGGAQTSSSKTTASAQGRALSPSTRAEFREPTDAEQRANNRAENYRAKQAEDAKARAAEETPHGREQMPAERLAEEAKDVTAGGQGEPTKSAGPEGERAAELEGLMKEQAEELARQGDFAKAHTVVDEIPPGEQKVLAKKYVEMLEATSDVLKKKELGPPVPTAEEARRVAANAEAPVLPSEKPQAPPVEMAETPARQNELAAMEGTVELDRNPLAGGAPEHVAALRGARDALPLRRPSSLAHRSGQDLIEAGGALEGYGYSKKFTGLSKEDPTRQSTSRSFGQLLRRIRKAAGVVRPEEVFDLTSTIYTPPVPLEAVRAFKTKTPFRHTTPKMVDVAGLIGPLKGPMSPKELADLTLPPDVARTIPEGPQAAEAVHAAFMEGYVRARQAFEREVADMKVPRKLEGGVFTGSYFERAGDALEGYLRWARAAEARGFNLHEPIGDKLKSPRQAYLDAVWNENWRLSSRSSADKVAVDNMVKEFERREYVAYPRRIQLGDFLEKRGFDHLVRALEVANGIGTAESLGKRAATAGYLYGKRGTPHALDTLHDWKMTDEEAHAILDAWKSRDWRALEERNVITRQVVDQHPIGEKASSKVPPELKGLKAEWGGDPLEDDFQRTLNEVDARTPDVLSNLTEILGGGGSAAAATRGEGHRVVEAKAEGTLRPEGLASLADPTDAAEAAADLRRMPADFLNAAELATSGEMGKAELAFANGFEKAIWNNTGEVGTIDALFRGDISTADGPLTSAAANYVRSIAKELTAVARGHGWLEENGGRIGISDRMSRLILKIQGARERNLDTRGRRRPGPTEGEGPDPTLWFCESPCAKKYEWDKPTIIAKRLWRMLVDRRPQVLTALDMYARQIVKPETRRFMSDTIFAKLFGSQRNLLGDPFANLMGKHQEEVTNLNIKFLGGWHDSFTRNYPELPYDIHTSPKWEHLTKAQQDGFLDSVRALDVVNGTPGAKFEELSDRGKAFAKDAREILHEAKKDLSKHLFRELIRAAQEADKNGTPVPPGLMRKWNLVLKGITDPKQALEALKAITDPPAGTWTEVGGQKFRSWGLEDYRPHLYGKSDRVNSAFAHLEDPWAQADAQELVAAAWLDGEQIPKAKKQAVEDYAVSHGQMGNRKFMRNLVERMGDNGYIRDPRWMPAYFSDLVRKVTYERMVDDTSSWVHGDWTPLQTKDSASLLQDLQSVATESTNSRHSLLGSVEDHYGLKLTGKLAGAGYRVLVGGKWIKPEKGQFGKEQRRLFAGKWRNDVWRLHSRSKASFTGPEEWSKDESGKRVPGWTMELSNGSETLVFYGRKAMEKAGIQIKKGGISNYREGGFYVSVKTAIRKATGYDVESGKYNGDEQGGQFGRVLKAIGDGVSEFWYQTQLGGYFNPKAGVIQAMEGVIQNVSAVGAKPLSEAMGHMKGYAQWAHYVLSSKNPAKAALEADTKFADTNYVKFVRPVLRESNTTINHLMRTHQASLDSASGKIQWAKRLSYMSFTLADVYSKEAAYYATWKQLKDVTEYRDPETGQRIKVTPNYIPVGDMFTRARGELSAHDVARMVMERTHFTIPRWAQPGLVQMPGWPLVGHLNTQALNITSEFWYGVAAAAKYAKTGDAIYQWQGQKAARYVAALAGAMIIARMLGRDIGQYVGSHVSDIGFGKATLGNILPITKQLPIWARVPGYQLPTQESLPMQTLFSPEPDKGIPAMLGNAMLRWQSGEQGLVSSFGSAAGGWLNHNAKAAILGPWSRSGRSIAAMATAERSDLDPERPWKVRDPWMFGPDGHTRYRDSFDLYVGDTFLPGWSYKDSAEVHRAKWENELNSVRGMHGSDLRKQLRSEDPQVVRAARREMLERGYKVEDWRQAKAGMMDALPPYARMAIGDHDQVSKLKAFAGAAARWAPDVRKLALRWILPTKSKFDPSHLPEGLWSEVQSSLRAPWSP